MSDITRNQTAYQVTGGVFTPHAIYAPWSNRPLHIDSSLLYHAIHPGILPSLGGCIFTHSSYFCYQAPKSSCPYPKPTDRYWQTLYLLEYVTGPPFRARSLLQTVQMWNCTYSERNNFEKLCWLRRWGGSDSTFTSGVMDTVTGCCIGHCREDFLCTAVLEH